MAALLLAAPPARAAEEPFVIPDGQEALVLTMLGGAEPLPGGCTLAGVSIDRATILARYGCASGPERAIRLLHPGAPDTHPNAETVQFWIVSPAPTELPPGLLDALATRIRAREAPFRWSEPAWVATRHPNDDPTDPPRSHAPPPPVAVSPVGYLGALLVPLLLAGSRRGPVLGTARRAAFTGAVAIAAFSVAYGALRSIGAAAAAIVLRAPGAALGALALSVACSVSFGILVHLARAQSLGRRHALAGCAVALALGFASYAPRDLGHDGDPARFGRVLAYPPGITVVDEAPHRPTIHVTTNARGFRGPDIADRPRDGVTRLVLIGDSFVFGSGLAWEDTLGEALLRALGQQAPARAFEAVNLGIPGDNLVSHLDVYEEAVASLHPACVVLCLTVPNDLSTYDDQQMRRAERHTSSYRLAEWAFGASFARLGWSAGKVSTSFDADAFAVLHQETARLTGMLRAPGTPPLLVFAYRGGPPELRTALETLPGATLVPTPPDDPDLWIPGDLHPSAKGNQVFAALLAASILALPATDK